MRRRNDSTTTRAFAGRKINISRGIGAILLPIFIGCATAPGPVIIQHERTPSQSDAALSNEQPRKEPADQRIAATMADLQRRKELSDQRTAALLDLLKSKNVISDEEATLISRQTATETAGEQSSSDVLEARQSVEDIKEQVRSEIANELLREVWKINWAMAEKDKRLRFTGDIRLRYEKDFFDENNYNQFTKISQGTDTQTLQNSWANQERFKYRVRFGAEALVNEQMNAVIRLASGSTTNPVSTNVAMGDSMNKDAVLFDLVYIKWRPAKWITVYGGRMPNPWFSTDLVWDGDLNFEGLALQTKTPLAESWAPFLTVGAFPLQQSDPVSTFDFSQHSKLLLGGQAGLERKSRNGIGLKIGTAYYNFKNITGVLNDSGNSGATDWSGPLYTQRGNTMFYIDPTYSYKVGLASEFKELNITGTLDIGFWDPVHIIFLGDYVKNLGFNQSKVNALVGDIDSHTEGFQAPAKQVEGYQYGLSIGYPATTAPGQWRAYFYKKRLQADAVVAGFTDSDFHLGGTNAKGWILGTDVGLAKNSWLALRWLTADEISGPPLAIDVLQVDLNARF